MREISELSNLHDQCSEMRRRFMALDKLTRVPTAKAHKKLDRLQQEIDDLLRVAVQAFLDDTIPKT